MVRRMLVMYDKEGNRPLGSRQVDLDMVRLLSAQGLRIGQIGPALGHTPSAWACTRAKCPEIQEEFDIGRAEGVKNVTGYLMTNIKDGNQKSIEYYLNNRTNGDWSSSKKVELTGEGGGPIKVAAITANMPASEAARKYMELMKG